MFKFNKKHTETKNTSVIILSAGNSTRMGKDKQRIVLLDKTVIEHSILAFEKNSNINEIIIVTQESNIADFYSIVSYNKFNKVKHIVRGGETRQQSAKIGCMLINENCETILIHDGARPLVSQSTINDVIENTEKHGAATASVPVKDTIKIVDSENFIESTPNRSKLYSCQTPQGFEFSTYCKAMEKAEMENKDYTDDCQLVENIGKKVFLAMGSYDNLKITTPDDVFVAENILMKRG